MRIELPGFLVQGMDKQGAHTGVLGHGVHAHERILKQGGAKLDALNTLINRKTGQDHDRYRVRHVAADGAARLLVRDGSGGQRVIPQHALIGIDNDERATGPVEMVGQCAAFEPIIQRRLSAVERIEAMGCDKQLRR